MTTLPSFSILIPLFSGFVHAGSSANYRIEPSAIASGGPSSSATYELVGSNHAAAGDVQESANYDIATGFPGQLPELADVALDAVTLNFAEDTSTVFSAYAVFTDGTRSSLLFNEVSVFSFIALANLDPNDGSAQTAVVAGDDPGFLTVNWLGFSDTLNFTVENTDPDNYGVVAGDGVDDAWQLENFGEADLALSLAGLDPDMDGQSNELEWLAGTDPNVASSRFTWRIDDVSRQSEPPAAAGPDVDVTRLALRLSHIRPGTSYYLERTDDFVNWQPIEKDLEDDGVFSPNWQKFTAGATSGNSVDGFALPIIYEDWFDREMFRLRLANEP